MANENDKKIDFTQEAPEAQQSAVDPELIDKDFDTTGVSNARRSEGLKDNIQVIREVDGWYDQLRLLPRLLFVYALCRLRRK